MTPGTLTGALLVLAAGCGGGLPPAHLEPAPPPVPQASPPETPTELVLPEWGAATGGPVRVHAADADGATLAMMLLPEEQSIVTEATGLRVTGRVAAPSRQEALAALVAAEPALAAVTEPIEITGTASPTYVELPPTPVGRALAVVAAELGRNVLLGGEPTQEVLVRASGVPADGLMGAIAAVADHTVRFEGSTAFVLRSEAAGALDARLLASRGSELDVRVSGATPAEALAVLDAVAPLRWSASCDAVRPFGLELRSERVGVVAAAVGYLSGVAFEPADPGRASCAPAAFEGELPTEGSRVLAAATTPRRTAALIRSADGDTRLLVSGGSLRILPSRAGVDVAIGEEASRAFEFAPPAEWPRSTAPPDAGPHAAIQMEDAADDGEGWSPRRRAIVIAEVVIEDVPLEVLSAALSGDARLAATILDDHGRAALIELAGGAWHRLRAGEGEETVVVIEERSIRLGRRDGSSSTELTLEPRVAEPH